MSVASAPAWAASLNSGKIAFATGDPLHVWTVKPNGKALHDLNAGTPADKTYCSPELSPDGARIAYVDWGTKPPLDPPSSSSDSSIVIANADGTGAHVIPTAVEQGYFCINNLTWSPDGHHLAFPGYAANAIPSTT